MPDVRHGDCLEVLRTLPDRSIDSLVTDPPAGISFMGREWDRHKGGRDAWVAWMAGVMAEALRVLRPGAHGLVWAIPRTQHWTATALEDAGFEVRDVITHLFGQGFPKSLDIGKAIDKAAGAEREVVRTEPDRWTGKGTTLNFATDRPQAEIQVLGAPATDAAKQWDGWGTALKPGHECWILVRKPLAAKSVAANVIAHGTGGVNIDGCRVGWVDDHDKAAGRPASSPNAHAGFEGKSFAIRDRSGESPEANQHAAGRWPANVVLSEDVAADLGDAARYFYTPKAPTRERPTGPDGTKHPTVKSVALMRWLCRLITPPGGTVLDPFAGSGATLEAAFLEGFDCIAIEAEAAYIPLIEQRLERCGLLGGAA